MKNELTEIALSVVMRVGTPAVATVTIRVIGLMAHPRQRRCAQWKYKPFLYLNQEFT